MGSRCCSLATRHRTFENATSSRKTQTPSNTPHNAAISVGFGFSVGDFIVAIKLVGTVIDARRSSGSAATEYHELMSQLLGLETALLQGKRLGFVEEQHAKVIALRQAAAQCQRTIDGFWRKVVKYQPSLSCEHYTKIKYTSQIKARLMKIK